MVSKVKQMWKGYGKKRLNHVFVAVGFILERNLNGVLKSFGRESQHAFG